MYHNEWSTLEYTHQQLLGSTYDRYSLSSDEGLRGANRPLLVTREHKESV